MGAVAAVALAFYLLTTSSSKDEKEKVITEREKFLERIKIAFDQKFSSRNI